MPTITVQGKTLHCGVGANLRQVLLSNQIPVHNGNAKIINCRGIGTCGTCAVDIEGNVSPLGWKEQARLSLPPHHPGTSRRLACQVKVLGDITVTKFDGFWGHGDRLNYQGSMAIGYSLFFTLNLGILKFRFAKSRTS